MKRRKSAPIRSDINVTPLVDVVLVLLIIFMVVTPMLNQGPKIQLPKADEPPKKPEDTEQIVITIQADGVIWVGKDSVNEVTLTARLGEMMREEPSSTIVVKGDAGLEYGVVKRVILGVRDAGFREVGLITEKRMAAGGAS